MFDLPTMDILTLNKGIIEIKIPNEIKARITEYISLNLASQNPYFCKENIAYDFAYRVFQLIIESYYANKEVEIYKLLYLINLANTGKNIPVFLISNTPEEPTDSLLSTQIKRGFNYGNDENDRMKKYFFTEWFSWCIIILMNHNSTIHPSEHGGGNRFHLISPIPKDDNFLRKVGASTGGGKFFQHSDATVYNDFCSINDLIKRLNKFNTNIQTVARRLLKTEDTIVSEVLCRKYLRVDATILSGIVNLNTKTHIGMPNQLQEHMQNIGFTKEQLLCLSKMPIAHIAGPADGEISGYVGNITNPINMDSSGNILGTCINAAQGRMIYVGHNNTEENLFDNFLLAVKSMPVHEILLTSSKVLFIPNSCYSQQTNVTHGRGELDESEYHIQIGNSSHRRMLCRQYVVSRYRDSKKNFLESYLNGTEY